MTAVNLREVQLRSHRFRVERENDWRRLESLLGKIDRRSIRSLSDEEITAMPVLYRSTVSALSVARATSLDRSLILYLESLTTRAYFLVYGSRSRPLERIRRFFSHDWPHAVCALRTETMMAAVLFFAGALAALLLTLHDPEWFSAFIPAEMAQGRNPAAETEALRKTLYDDGGREGLSAFATFLFTHNAQISVFAFALGFAFCVPTAALMAYNGGSLGAFVALYASRGLGTEAGGWLLIHGTTELFAVILAGAAGFRIGWAIAFPGSMTRLDAAAAAGRTAATVMIGVVVMLMVAGALEGFGRQLITNDLARYTIAAVMLLMWLAYFYAPRRGRAIRDPR